MISAVDYYFIQEDGSRFKVSRFFFSFQLYLWKKSVHQDYMFILHSPYIILHYTKMMVLSKVNYKRQTSYRWNIIVYTCELLSYILKCFLVTLSNRLPCHSSLTSMLPFERYVYSESNWPSDILLNQTWFVWWVDLFVYLHCTELRARSHLIPVKEVSGENSQAGSLS